VKYLLDTNAVIGIIAGNPGLVSRFSEHAPKDFVISSVVMFELYCGAYKSRQTTENLNRIAALRFDVLDFSVADAKVAGQIRANLTAQGTPIGAYDVLVAGQAVARSLTLITRNVKEFCRVTGLDYENWQT